MNKQLPIGVILKEARELIGEEQVLNILRFFNEEKGYLDGGSVHLSSYENWTMYTNGKTILLKLNNGNEIIDFYFNGKALPYMEVYNKELKIAAQKIYTHMLNTDEKIIRKFKCVKYIMNNYAVVFTFMLNGKRLSKNSIKHQSTLKLVEEANVKLVNPNESDMSDKFNNDITPPKETKIVDNAEDEIAVAKDETKKQDIKLNNNKIRSYVFKLAHKLRRKYEAEDELFKKTAYRDRLSFCVKEAWERVHSLITNSSKEVAVAKIISFKEKKEEKENNKPVQEIRTEDKNKECTISSNNKYKLRKENHIYVTFEIGKIKLENEKGETLKCIDISNQPHPAGKKTYGECGIDSTKRYFRNFFMDQVDNNFMVIVIDKEDKIFNREDGHTYIVE